MAGHVMRKTDGRWSNALLNWNEGKTQGHNTNTLYWEHDIEVWIQKRFPADHSTWQQLAKHADQLTKWRNEYAEDWPSNQRMDTYHKLHKNVTSHSSRRQKQNRPSHQNPPEQAEAPVKIVPIDSVLQDKSYDTDKHKGCLHSRLIPMPGKRRRITIVLNFSRQVAYDEEATR